LDRGSAKPLLLRVASAAILGPLALAAVWAGGGWLLAVVLLAALGMGWEWSRLAARRGFGLVGALVVLSGLVATALLGAGAGVGSACLGAALGAAMVFAGALVTGNAEPVWAAAGALWLSLGAVAFLALARPPIGGRETLFWLLGVVWVNDVAAYAFGRAIGGPKLAPRLSPNKTWAGFVGGVASAGALGWAAARLVGAADPAPLAATSLLLAVAGQLGDLAESAAKRHFGVKDSSRLIPGHGGLLDRVDGLLAASMAAAALSLGAGRSPLFW
jgi:phosphatidate cytidylyltransferase